MTAANRYPLQPRPGPRSPFATPCSAQRKPSAQPTPRPARRTQGLSRFEFALVVVVWGVVLSMALAELPPWLTRLRELRLAQALAAVRVADTRFRAACSAVPRQACDQLSFDGQAIEGVHGHAAATATGIARLAQLDEMNLILKPGLRDGVPALTVAVLSPTAQSCEFTYVQPPMQGAAAAIESLHVSCQ